MPDLTHDEVYALQPCVLDALHAAGDSTLAPSTPWVAHRWALTVKPNVVRADGTLTRRGERIRDWLHDNNYLPTGHLPFMGPAVLTPTRPGGDRP